MVRHTSFVAAAAVIAAGGLVFPITAANAGVIDSTDIIIGVPNASLSGFTGLTQICIST